MVQFGDYGVKFTPKKRQYKNSRYKFYVTANCNFNNQETHEIHSENRNVHGLTVLSFFFLPQASLSL